MTHDRGWSEGLSAFFAFFAARFSFKVLPGVLSFDFLGDLSDTITPHGTDRANQMVRSHDRRSFTGPASPARAVAKYSTLATTDGGGAVSSGYSTRGRAAR
jgi:hypothetical protein